MATTSGTSSVIDEEEDVDVHTVEPKPLSVEELTPAIWLNKLTSEAHKMGMMWLQFPDDVRTHLMNFNAESRDDKIEKIALHILKLIIQYYATKKILIDVMLRDASPEVKERVAQFDSRAIMCGLLYRLIGYDCDSVIAHMTALEEEDKEDEIKRKAEKEKESRYSYTPSYARYGSSTNLGNWSTGHLSPSNLLGSSFSNMRNGFF